MKSVVMALLTFFALTSFAQEKKENEESLEKQLIDSNIAISNWFDSMAEGLDLFLVGKKLTKEKNASYIKIENTSSQMEGEGFSNSSSFNINLRLPNLEEYWQLKFTSYDEKEENRNVRSGYLRQTQREKNLGATVGLFRKLGHVKTSFLPRIGLQDPLKVSQTLRFESVADLKTYQVNPKLEFYANADNGTGIFWNLNFNFTLNKVLSFTLLNEANYEDKAHLYSAGNGFSLGQFVTPSSTIAWALTFNSNNRPSYHLESYVVSIAWNQLLYKKILDYQIIPHLDFSKEFSFRGRTGLIFNLNLTF